MTSPQGTDNDPIRKQEQLARKLAPVLLLGRLLLSAGAGAYRTTTSMERAAAALGIDRCHTEVTHHNITITAYRGKTFRTLTADQRLVGVNADRLESLNRVVASLHKDMTPEELDKQLKEIEKKHHLYGWFMNAFMSGVACAAFTFLNYGGPVECSSVFVAAFIGQLLRRQMLIRRMNHVGVWMICGFVAASIYVGVVSTLYAMDFATHAHQSGYVASILFLVPGFPMVTSILDMVRGDYLAGLSRASYVIMTMVSAGFSVWLVSYLFSWQVSSDYHLNIDYPWLLLGRVVASFIAAYGFAVLFNTPPWICTISATIAIFSNLGRLVLSDYGMFSPLSVGIAALGVGLAAAAITEVITCSRVALSVPAVVIMIPGVPFYRSLTVLTIPGSDYYRWFEAVTPLIQVLVTILAIGIGLAIARMLTDRNWAFDTQDHCTPNLEADSRHPVR